MFNQRFEPLSFALPDHESVVGVALSGIDGEQDPPLGVAVMEFMVSYEDDLMEPETNDLSAVHADWNLLTEPDEQNEAEDKVTFTP